MQKIQIGEVNLKVHVQGQGTPLLLVHGFPLDHTMWQAQIAEFSRDHLVIAPDLRGFGESELGAEPLSMAGLADDLAAMLAVLEVTQPIIFCGLSMGGYVAWQFWDRHAARLARLVLCDTRAAADSEVAANGRREAAERVLSEGLDELIAGMVPKLFADNTGEQAPQVIQSTRQVMGSTAPKTIASALLAMAERPNMESRLREIAVPTLLLCGSQDVITPPAEMRANAAAIPQARFEEVASAGHMAPLEQPAAVNRIMRAFLKDDA